VRVSYGSSGTSETPEAYRTPRRLSAGPAESEYLQRKSTIYLKVLKIYLRSNNVYENRS
jgi:hypothetical protein